MPRFIVDNHSKELHHVKVSIGVPVYNGEKFLRKRLDSLISQTFTDFEVVISDNASTDATSEICQEYSKKDERIRYIRQEKNMGAVWNFNFVLKEAAGDYFAWAAADDLWHSDFLKKNVSVLTSNPSIVGSISQIEVYGIKNDPFKREKNLLKKIGVSFRPRGFFPISGPYEKRIRAYLAKFPWEMIYGVYRTKNLRQSVLPILFVGSDAALVLNILKYGDINVVDEFLMYGFGGSESASKGIFHLAINYNNSLLGVIFPFYPLTAWCMKNLGIKLFLKNFDHFIRLNFDGGFFLFVDLVRWFKMKQSKK